MIPDFDEAKHEYRVGRALYPSVTQILGGLGMLKDLSFLEPFYRQRGSATHHAIDLHFRGLTIDWDFEGAEHVTPRFERFLRLRETARLMPVFWESPLASSTWQYAGTPDYVGRFFDHPLAIVDWKGDAPEPGHSLQVAGGYRGLLCEAAANGEVDLDPAELLQAPCFLVPLGGDAALPRHHPIEDEDGAALDLFRGAAACWNWRLAHNLNGGSR
jgi:hypothetical protein